MKDILKNIVILLLILVIIYIFIRSRCDNSNPIGWWASGGHVPFFELDKPTFSTPSSWTHGSVPADTVYITVYEDPPPTTEISGGQISSSGDLAFEIAYQDTFKLVRWHTGHYYGTGTIAVSQSGDIGIHYPRIAFQPIVSGGVSQKGVGLSLETLHFNNILGSGTTLHAPVLLLESDYDALESIEDTIDSTSIGIGASVDLLPDRTNLRLGGAWMFEANDLKKQELSIFLHARLIDF